jgi:hypothetical protein
MTFSVPFTTKYPPGSSGHSVIAASCAVFFPVNTHLLLLSMIGNLPILIPFDTTSCFPRVYLTET